MKDYSKIGGKSTMQRTSRRLEGTAMGSTVFDLKPGVGIGPFYIGMRFLSKSLLLFFSFGTRGSVNHRYRTWKMTIGIGLRSAIACRFRILLIAYSISNRCILVHHNTVQPPISLIDDSDQFDRRWCCFSGMPICDAFGKIEQDPNVYDVVHVKYYDEDPLKLDVVISFPDHGFHLRFDPSSQRLRLIEIYDVKRLQMRYGNSTIGGPSTLATFVAVYALFGPTFPGIYDKERGVYALFYPGLSFEFPIPDQYTDCCHDGEVALPLEFSDGTTPVTCRVSIYDKSSDKKVGVGKLMDRASVPPLAPGSLYMEEVHVKLGKELYFTVGGQHMPFGASPQDVDQMVIHSASDLRPKTTLCGDYFYNYFTRGFDILFDGETHKAKKFVLHTNYPGHADFNSYIKCNFMISVGEGETEANRGGNKITPSTNWEQVKEVLGECGPAAIQTQGSTSNPFGSTYVYGYKDVAFEVKDFSSDEERSYSHHNFVPVMMCVYLRGAKLRSSLPELMTASGLTVTPPRFHFRWRTSQRTSQPFTLIAKLNRLDASASPLLQRACLALPTQRNNAMIPRAMSSSFGDVADDSTAVFPRINVKDPYKRLGISRMASEDEIQGARNFLMQQYSGHKPSVDAIESAHDKIIMQKFHERKNPKIDITKKVREVRQSKAVNFVFERFQTPATAFLVKTAVTFAVLGALTVLFPTEEGPTLQVLLSVIATFYFIHQRLKKKFWSFLYGSGSFIFSWLIGTFLMVSVIPPFIKGPRGFEVMSSLLSYVLLWVSSSYLR
ncbi:hypothetical protein YC2023_110206 [Brassica napus]